MRKGIADKLVEAYLYPKPYGIYNLFYDYKTSLNLDINGRIWSQHTPMGYFESVEDTQGIWHDFLVLTLQNFRSQPNWKKQKKQLAWAANKAQIPVVFVDVLDIFYGEMQTRFLKQLVITKRYDALLEVAKYSQDTDIKTACQASQIIYNEDYKDEAIVFSYNQLINNEFVHAEQIVCEWLDCHKEYRANDFTCLLEPCADCIKRMINSEAEYIWYAYSHKAKWNTFDYIQLTNDIHSGLITTNEGYKIKYAKYFIKQVNKFYEKKKEVK